ncbi:hypothetical protein CEXT_354921 [Caerostris extrusa]|uniref:Secreted protein n=1 Tax=Caerostris extrusa TaxID=172846 RepID=A0AAV4UQD4_CAEEX|nr:hypothetical protein CEXT_354921 [Caerostris extrusa]
MAFAISALMTALAGAAHSAGLVTPTNHWLELLLPCDSSTAPCQVKARSTPASDASPCAASLLRPHRHCSSKVVHSKPLISKWD